MSRKFLFQAVIHTVYFINRFVFKMGLTPDISLLATQQKVVVFIHTQTALTQAVVMKDIKKGLIYRSISQRFYYIQGSYHAPLTTHQMRSIKKPFIMKVIKAIHLSSMKGDGDPENFMLFPQRVNYLIFSKRKGVMYNQDRIVHFKKRVITSLFSLMITGRLLLLSSMRRHLNQQVKSHTTLRTAGHQTSLNAFRERVQLLVLMNMSYTTLILLMVRLL